MHKYSVIGSDSRTSAGATWASLVGEVFRRWSGQPCLTDGATGLTWSYSQAADVISQWADRFTEFGLSRGDGVAILSGNRIEVVPAFLSVISSGLRYTALHPLSSAQDLDHILIDADISTVIYDRDMNNRAGLMLAERHPDKQFWDIESMMPRIQSASQIFNPPCEVSEDDIAMLTYTGGTTGRPKGVIQTHRVGVQCFMLELADWPWPRRPRFLAVTPLSHATRQMVMPVFWRGGTIVTLPGPSGIGAAIGRYSVDCTFVVPSVLYRILDGAYGDPTDFASLKLIIYGGSPIAPDRLAEAVDRYGPVFLQLYGQVEAPQAVTALQPEDHDPGRPHLFSSCGRPTPTTEVVLLREDGSEVPTGEIGELCVRGRIVMEGYWKRPEETRQALSEGWLHTGDLARMDEEDYLYIVDRKKDMIITGGFNVFSREVEDALMSHPDVAVAAVVGLPDPHWGEAVVAVVVSKPGANPTESELQEFVRAAKGPIHAPKQVLMADSLPLTGLGKPDKKGIRDAIAAGSANRELPP
jgi:fatty-acyl-CoA synthase